MTEPRTVLVVEDDKSIQRVYAEALTAAGFTVLTERDGEWALTTFAARQVDVVLIDALIPVQNGFAVVEQLRATKKGAKVPVLMMSGVYRSAKSKTDALERLGCLEFLEKPADPSRIVASVQRALGVAAPDPERVRLERARLEAKAGELATVIDREEAQSVEEHEAAPTNAAIQVAGNFKDTPFTEVLFELHRLKATGALLLRREKVKKIVFVKDGVPVFVKSNLLTECLGKVMVRERMITDAECEESLRQLKATGRQQGAILIDLGSVSPNNLTYALQLQLETKLFDVFGWPDGDYRFNPKAEVPGAITTLDMTLARILYEGVRRTYDDARAAATLSGLGALSVLLADDPMDRFQDMGLDLDESRLYASLDGKKTIDDVVGAGLLPAPDARKLLYALKCAQMIRFGPPALDGPPPLEEPRSAELATRTPPDPQPSLAVIEARRAAQNAALPALPAPTPAPATGGAPTWDDDETSSETALRERLAARLSDLQRMTYYEVLGLERGATEVEVKRGYLALAKELHPDKHFAGASPAIRRLAEAIFHQVTHAHAVLTSTTERAQYERELAAGTVGSDTERVRKILEAEDHFRRGEALLARKQFAPAREALAAAAKLYPDEAEFHALLGWASWEASPPGDASANIALGHLDQAVRLNAKLDKAYLFRGRIFKALAKPQRAEAEFAKALQCNPSSREALRELRRPPPVLSAKTVE